MGIVGDLDYIAVQVPKVATIATPKDSLGRLHDDRPESLCLLHHGIDLLLGHSVVA